jgi:predicted NBD/HSP70 family sugar kinase
MGHFAGMDVSVKETSVCILDDAGKIVKEVKVASEPHALLKVLENRQRDVKRCVLTSLGSSGITLVPASRSRMRSSRVSMAAGSSSRSIDGFHQS